METSEKREVICFRCKGGNPTDATRCIWCDAPLSEVQQQFTPPSVLPPQWKRTRIAPADLRQILGITGGIILIVSTFLPLLSGGGLSVTPLNSKIGVGPSMLGVMAIILALLGHYRAMIIPGLGTLALTIYQYLDMKGIMDDIGLLEGGRVRWEGWGIMVIGSLLLVVITFLPPKVFKGSSNK